jgi:hypothetical protein
MATNKPLKAHSDSQKKSAEAAASVMKEVRIDAQAFAEMRNRLAGVSEEQPDATEPKAAEDTKATESSDEATLLQLIPGATLTATGLHLEKKLTPDSAFAIARRLGSINDALQRGALQWGWGDLAVEAEDFPKESQQAFKKLVDKHGIDPKTLANYKSVAKKFPPSRRREGLYFGHYDAVMGLATNAADDMLKYAAQRKFSVSALRSIITKQKNEAEEAARKKKAAEEAAKRKAAEEAAKKAAEEAAKNNSTKPNDTGTGTGTDGDGDTGGGTEDTKPGDKPDDTQGEGTGTGCGDNYLDRHATNEEVLKEVDEWVKGVNAVEISWDISLDDDDDSGVPPLSALGVDDKAFYEATAQLMSEFMLGTGQTQKSLPSP